MDTGEGLWGLRAAPLAACVGGYDCGVVSVADLLERVDEKLNLAKEEVKPTDSRVKKVFKSVGSPARRELVVSLFALLNDLKTELVAQHATTEQPTPSALRSTGAPEGELAVEDIEAIYDVLDLIRFKRREGSQGSARKDFRRREFFSGERSGVSPRARRAS